ncbi:MAG: DNA primase [Sphingomonadaceae bacterium]|nr:DNA primase [Sphingomonadaceae bacterium]
MTLTPQWLDELRARITLSALIGRTVKITKAGREFKACCPFHNEKSPSFTINDEKGFYHCLAGETVVMTDQGRFPISALSGKSHLVLSRKGQWIRANFDSYGEQRLWKISLSRNGVKKQIFATSGHRWFVHDRVSEYLTTDLKPGYALQSALPNVRQDWSLDPEGIRHGIVYGDGTMYKGVYGTLNLHGEKDVQLRQYFPEQKHHIHEREGGALYLRIYGGRAFEDMKALPKNGASQSYLLGFLAGYLAADGHVAKDGTVMLNSSNAETLEAIRDICTALGITTYGRTTLWRKGYGKTPSALHRIHFVNSGLAEELFLLSKARQRFAASRKKFARLRWVVCSVEETDRVETVYCADVPKEHAFALDDNILTGNCFGCSAHGDAIRWMTDQRGLSFMDAIKELAAEAGMEVPAADPKAAQRAEKANSLYDVMTAAQAWFVSQLLGVEGSAARGYLKQRGFTEQIIRDFGFGLAPDNRTGLKTALKQFGDPMLIEAGLLISVDGKAPYDRFRGRLMIPIRDPRGRVIAFGGRILGEGEPKYLNSPDTPLFDKGRTLYNLDKCSPASRQTGRVIVVEGYMDVIALAQAGFADAVAPLGTALTEQQIQMLWRMTEKPSLCFDGDAAGQKAAMRAALRALPLLKPGHSLQFVTLPEGQDPDDLVKASGANALNMLLEASQPLVERLWQAEVGAATLSTPEDRAGLKQRLGAHMANITDGEIRRHYADAFRERFDNLFAPRRSTAFTPSAPFVRGQKRDWRKPPILPPGAETKNFNAKGSDFLIQGILAALLRHPALIAQHHEALSDFVPPDPNHAALLNVMLNESFSKETLDTEGLITILSEKLYNVASALLHSNIKVFAFNRREFGTGGDGFSNASKNLGEAIRLMKQRPALEEALERATQLASLEVTEATFAEQQRLRHEKKVFDERIIEFFRRDADSL